MADFKIKLYKFYKTNCPPCYSLSRILNTIVFPDEIELININVEAIENKEIIEKFEIEKVPVLLFDSENKIIGLQSKQTILSFIEKEIAKYG